MLGPDNQIKLTTRGRYAVTALVELAQRGGATPVRLAELAASTKISLSYLEQLFAGLRRHGLVKSHRGPGGGYMLARPIKDIYIVDILRAAEDSAPARRGAGSADETIVAPTPVYDLWQHIGHIMYATMRHVSLDEVLGRKIGENPMLNKMFDSLR